MQPKVAHSEKQISRKPLSEENKQRRILGKKNGLSKTVKLEEIKEVEKILDHVSDSKNDAIPSESKADNEEKQPINKSLSLSQLMIKPASKNPKQNEKERLNQGIPKRVYNLESWKIAHGIPKEKKVFIINGIYPDVRNALLERGWIENTDLNSNFYDLQWARSGKQPLLLKDWQLFNHFPKNSELATKWRLCGNLKRINSVEFFPRCFRLKEEMSEFFEYYKILRIIGRLKKFISSPDDFPKEKLVLCIVICQRYIEHILRSSKDQINLVSSIEWKNLTSSVPFDVDGYITELHIENLDDMEKLVELSKNVLARLETADPQFFLSGTGKIWIVKPGGKSRGRGISLFSEISDIRNYTNNGEKWVIQKYIENPLLINHKKFDIRQWILISNADPVTIWIYKDCYLRFSVEKYSVENLENPFIHLTNNSISKNSEAFEENEDGCMWHVDSLKDYLFSLHGKDMWTDIFEKIKEIVTISVLSVGNLGRKRSFEVLGYDFMVDENLKPWLIEINSSPAIDYSTPVTEVLVKQVLSDAIKVVIDHRENENCETGKFEICHQAKVKALR